MLSLCPVFFFFFFLFVFDKRHFPLRSDLRVQRHLLGRATCETAEEIGPYIYGPCHVTTERKADTDQIAIRRKPFILPTVH